MGVFWLILIVSEGEVMAVSKDGFCLLDSRTIPDDDDDGGGGGGGGDGGGLKARTRLTSLECCFLRQPIIGSCSSAIREGVCC